MITLLGTRTVSGNRTSEGYREYDLTSLLVTDDNNIGPATILQSTLIPQIGDIWNFGTDVDVWAYCHPDAEVSIHQEKEGSPAYHWKVKQKFSTKSFGRCQDAPIGDPLQEPQKISGTFVKFTEEARYDLYGNPLIYSSLEKMHGPQVEFDANRPSVRIEQNVSSLDLPIFSPMVDSVNDSPLWGLPARCVKLSNASWERKYYGKCSVYYSRTFDFDINFDGFDRNILDIGTKVLNGAFDATGVYVLKNVASGVKPDPNNPQHFIQYLDKLGNPTPVVLNGAGLPALAALAAVVRTNGQSSQIVSITRVGTTATCTIVDTIGFPNGSKVQVSGCSGSDAGLYNGTQIATVTGANTFTYLMGDTPSGSAVLVTSTGLPWTFNVQKYSPANFLLLNIPTSF